MNRLVNNFIGSQFNSKQFLWKIIGMICFLKKKFNIDLTVSIKCLTMNRQRLVCMHVRGSWRACTQSECVPGRWVWPETCPGELMWSGQSAQEPDHFCQDIKWIYQTSMYILKIWFQSFFQMVFDTLFKISNLFQWG